MVLLLMDLPFRTKEHQRAILRENALRSCNSCPSLSSLSKQRGSDRRSHAHSISLVLPSLTGSPSSRAGQESANKGEIMFCTVTGNLRGARLEPGETVADAKAAAAKAVGVPLEQQCLTYELGTLSDDTAVLNECGLWGPGCSSVPTIMVVNCPLRRQQRSLDALLKRRVGLPPAGVDLDMEKVCVVPIGRHLSTLRLDQANAARTGFALYKTGARFVALGVDIDVKSLEVNKLNPVEGLVCRWNRKNPGEALNVGDQILEVNGARDREVILKKELTRRQTLLVTTVQRRRKHPPPPTFEEGWEPYPEMPENCDELEMYVRGVPAKGADDCLYALYNLRWVDDSWIIHSIRTGSL